MEIFLEIQGEMKSLEQQTMIVSSMIYFTYDMLAFFQTKVDWNT